MSLTVPLGWNRLSLFTLSRRPNAESDIVCQGRTPSVPLLTSVVVGEGVCVYGPWPLLTSTSFVQRGGQART